MLNSFRIVQYKMIMKSSLIQMQDDHENGRAACHFGGSSHSDVEGQIGMLRPDANSDTECRNIDTPADRSVSEGQCGNRVGRPPLRVLMTQRMTSSEAAGGLLYRGEARPQSARSSDPFRSQDHDGQAYRYRDANHG